MAHETELCQKLSWDESKILAVPFSDTYRYIDDVLSKSNNTFHSHVSGYGGLVAALSLSTQKVVSLSPAHAGRVKPKTFK
jgi:hypothetical protein